ncbi:hypothetical protein Ato02nite_035650 [Paractinoplanes toevensis]|uniref:Uncharacterized protein n=2 Tax=Paractinoplanes toevensis TaxID=571911 RepID=A0A919W0X3_9ACTN|nr:hypothetical protein Ato02nite_035650 [Actinoplanes toevensis]
MGLTACGTATETAAPAATTAAAAAETTAAPAAAETTAAPAAAGSTDKEICEQANKASESFKKAVLVFAQTVDEIPAADAKLMLTDFAKSLTKAAEGADGAVATAVKANADAALEAAAAKHPVEAADSAEAAKAGKDLNAACKAAGVTTNF